MNKGVVIVGVVIAAVVIAAVVLYFNSDGSGSSGVSGVFGGGGLSGRYESRIGSIEFTGGNKVTVRPDSLASIQATYKLEGNKFIVTANISGFTETSQGTVSDDKQTITLDGSVYTKVK